MPTPRELRLDQDRQNTLDANKNAIVRDFEAAFPDRPAFQILVDSYFLLFPQDQVNAKVFFQMLEKEPTPKDKAYLDLILALFQDVAAYGFPQISGIFTPAHQAAVLRATDRTPLDPANIFAIRTYLADLNLQTLELKQKYLDSFAPTSRFAGDNTPEKIDTLYRRIAGTMLPVQNGKVSSTGQLELNQRDVQQRAKFPSDVVWLPDKDQAQAMLALGKALGRTEGYDRDKTYKTIGRVKKESLAIIFPDLLDEKFPVSTEERQLAETAFRGSGPNPVILKYDQLRSLFAGIS